MNILYLHRTQGDGVEGVHVWEIARSLKAEGHQVRVLSPAGEAADPDASEPAPSPSTNLSGPHARRFGRGSLFGLISRRFPEFVFEALEIAYNAVALVRVAGIMRGQRQDLIYERYAIFAIAGALSAWIWGCRWVLEVNYTSHSPLVRRRSALLKPLAARIDRWLFARAHGLVAVSTALRDELVRTHGADPDKIIVVPNAADPDRFSPQVTPLDEIGGVPLAGRRAIGFVGGFYPWHGLPMLLEAFARLAGRFEDTLLLLVGDGPERPAIEARANSGELASRVVFAGRVDHRRLPHYVAALHVGVLPDSNSYCSPMKIFEYMAMGLPVVVPDYSPLLDVVTDGVEGRVFRRGDVDGLSEAIAGILSDPATHRKMSAAARERIVLSNNWRENARRILALCRVPR